MSTALRPRTGLSAGHRTPDGRLRRRRALYHLTAPVAVLTVSHGGILHGTTVSTVTTVSREPLLLGTCLRSGSQFAELAVASGRYAVNVLTGAQADLARYFADSSRPGGADQFAGLGWEPDPYAHAPLLEGALAHYTCRLYGSTALGDHEVLIGHVTHAAVGEGTPLLSYAGGLFSSPLTPVRDPGSGSQTRKDTTT
ncbi:flavin reductase family protein [Streptomyces caelestis]|jgi:flavin reductase (DIM6/NTAB) family NADH-FMN oxidoreductase RutF|uniref:Flavin reductase (DIM6/NTAB) family NADH-FMN oxidoreductase RutF n=1 Tax=Streptomyces caelestis TaxID=36816 RepID=A0A7W9LQ95_9ACTN|nr:flavin reductase family protein [Streptomyces caelestis]MBB5792131.1 flavin reductase (DIM6/NTAB) family NADH-FMN oxidoreductase RutF [Streptomyces caelestis]GGW79725.1 monooxygenase [Streptomyces caelestis]